MQMFRKALVAIATAVAVTAAASTGAFARGGHFHGGHGFHGSHGFHGGYHGGFHRGWGASQFIYAPYAYAGYYGSCYQVRRILTPYGLRLRRVYVCG